MTVSRPQPRFIAVLFLLLALAACAGMGPGLDATAPTPAAAPANINPGDLVGSWGLAAYHREADRARTEAAARGQCAQPYVIGRGPTGGVMMHLADAAQPRELRLKAGAMGKSYIGPEGPAGDAQDREILSFDGRTLIVRWVDPEVASRYGTMIYVRCGAAGTRATKRAPSPKSQ